jgi:hypothetical protein
VVTWLLGICFLRGALEGAVVARNLSMSSSTTVVCSPHDRAQAKEGGHGEERGDGFHRSTGHLQKPAVCFIQVVISFLSLIILVRKGAPMAKNPQDPSLPGGLFPETQWSLIHRVRQEGPDGAAALEELCRGYWQPIYGFLRARGCSKGC